MAAFKFKLPAANFSTTTSTKTIAQVTAPTNHRLRITRVTISCQGTSTTAEPIEFQVVRQTTLGTGTNQAPVKADDSISDTLLTVGTVNYTVEPTLGDILHSVMVHPQTGFDNVIAFPDDLIVGGGDRLGVRCVSPAAAVDCSVTIEGEE